MVMRVGKSESLGFEFVKPIGADLWRDVSMHPSAQGAVPGQADPCEHEMPDIFPEGQKFFAKGQKPIGFIFYGAFPARLPGLPDTQLLPL